MKVAPNGTAYPARASLLLCGLHEGMRLAGTLEATYITVGEPSRIDSRRAKAEDAALLEAALAQIQADHWSDDDDEDEPPVVRRLRAAIAQAEGKE